MTMWYMCVALPVYLSSIPSMTHRHLPTYSALINLSLCLLYLKVNMFLFLSLFFNLKVFF